ncbi:MAG: hypothetical protein ACTHZW_03320 [Microbacteriaceae bacterium]
MVDDGGAPQEPKRPDEDEMPDTEQMEQPSSEKEQGEEPQAPAREEPEPSHEAVGIGIIGRPQVESDEDDPSA